MKTFNKSFCNFKIIGEHVPFSIRDIFKIVWFIRVYCLPKLFIVYYVFYVKFEEYAFLTILNKLTYYFLYAFLSLSDLLLRNFFLSFDLTIKPRWISLFMKCVWFARINLFFSAAIVFTTGHFVELRELGFDRARVLETSGLICYDQINTRGIGGFL